MLDTPKANRLHISFFGKRNAGKSSLVNALTNQDIALVSSTPGTTTDPVFKAMELLPLGPVMIVDTAGLDDEGALGELRIKKTLDIMDRTDLGILVFTGESSDFSMEKRWKEELTKRNIPVIGVINKIDEFNLISDELKNDFDIPFVSLSAKEKINISEFKQAIINTAPTDFELPTIVGDILRPKARVVLVAPQDIQAPKGRLILPQVQIIRDVLDYDAMALTVKDSELLDVLADLKCDPDLVITDSQIFGKVNEIIPPHVPLTSFSILMARYKGDLNTFVKGARAMKDLRPGDKILIAEACTHHALKGDIAREKLPIWIKEKYGDVEFVNLTGVDFPDNIKDYKLIIHCGSCMFTRKQLMSRLVKAEAEDMPITNFGTAIAYLNGILDRVVEMFPEIK